MLVGITYYVKFSKENLLAVGYTSVSIASATFIVILAYHIFHQLRHTNLWKKMPKLNLELRKLNTVKEAEDNSNNKPMIAHFDQLRELWLEDLLPLTHSQLCELDRAT